MEQDYKLVENEGLFQEYLEMGKPFTEAHTLKGLCHEMNFVAGCKHQINESVLSVCRSTDCFNNFWLAFLCRTCTVCIKLRLASMKTRTIFLKFLKCRLC
jgi:hypothetical protein